MKELMKKKIILFTSTGGGGHLSVSNALGELLSTDYEVITILIMGDLLKSVDPAQVFTFGLLKGEDTYNYLIQHQWNTTINQALSLTQSYFSLRSTHIKKILHNYLKQQKPDLIISVFHLFNRAILDCAQLLDIPFILVPTDLDATAFIHQIQNPTYDKFKIAASFDNEEIRAKISTAKINPQTIVTTGFPLKKDFSEPKDAVAIKTLFKLPANKKIIMILMGAQGSKATITYAQELASLQQEVHLVFCLGKNEKIKSILESIPFPKHISYTCIGFTNKIADLMFIADLIITKSGSVSVCEALYTNLPMILDATHTPLAWEKFNHTFIEQMGFGRSLTNKKELCALINKMLNTNELHLIQKRLLDFNKKQGTVEIKKLIGNLLTNNPISQDSIPIYAI